MRVRAEVCARCLLATVVAGFLLFRPDAVMAKDLSGRWYFGGNLGFHTTQDSSQNNAALAGDPRPDRFQNREMSVEDGLGYSVTAGYGMTRMLSFQLDLGYFKGDVGEVDVYLTDTFPLAGIPGNPTNVDRFKTRETTIPVTAGALTQVPVTLSAILRFRPTATVNPWISAGLGKVYTEVAQDADLARLNDRMRSLRIRAVSDELGNDLTGSANQPLQGDGKVPMQYPVSIEVEDGKQWHLAVGFDYSLNDRISVTTDIRWVSVDQEVVVELEGQDQVEFTTFSEKLFRKDGSLKYFSSDGITPNPLIDPLNIALGRVRCAPSTSSDFDRDGHRDDLCFRYGTESQISGTFLVQGGAINLSGFALNIGLRVHF